MQMPSPWQLAPDIVDQLAKLFPASHPADLTPGCSEREASSSIASASMQHNPLYAAHGIYFHGDRASGTAVHHCEIMPTIDSAPASPSLAKHPTHEAVEHQTLDNQAQASKAQAVKPCSEPGSFIKAFFGRATRSNALDASAIATPASASGAQIGADAKRAPPWRTPWAKGTCAAPALEQQQQQQRSSRASAYLISPRQSQSQGTSDSHAAPRSTVSSLLGSTILPIPSWLSGREVVIPKPDDRPPKFAAMASIEAPLTPPARQASKGTAASPSAVSFADLTLAAPDTQLAPAQPEHAPTPGMAAKLGHAVSALQLRIRGAPPAALGASEGQRGQRRVPKWGIAALVAALLLVAIICIAVPVATSKGGSSSDAAAAVVPQGPPQVSMRWVQLEGTSEPPGLVQESASFAAAELGRWQLPAAQQASALVSLVALAANVTRVV